MTWHMILRRGVQGPAEEVALYNIAEYYCKNQDFSTARGLLETAATRHPTMNKRCILKCLTLLKTVYKELGEARLSEDVAALMVEHGLKVEVKKGGGAAKRVVFSLDYSGSMAGGKIRSALLNLETNLRDHINDDDQVALLCFNASVHVSLPLQIKKGRLDHLVGEVRKLCQPMGPTAFFDSVDHALGMLAQARTQDSHLSEWIVALTDGDDNRSKITCESLAARLSREPVDGLIVIGVGSEVVPDKLQLLAKATRKGTYLKADSHQESITEAFSQVAKLIQGGDVVLEDF
jgi:Mg-chelatase subunit ChlD